MKMEIDLTMSIHIILKANISRMSNNNRHQAPQQMRFPNMNPMNCPCEMCRQAKRSFANMYRQEIPYEYMQRFGFDYSSNMNQYQMMSPQALYMFQNPMRNYYCPDPSTPGFLSGNPMSGIGMGIGMNSMSGMAMNGINGMNGMNPMVMQNSMQRIPQSIQRNSLNLFQQPRREVICLDSEQQNERMEAQNKQAQQRQQEVPHGRLRSAAKRAMHQENKQSLAAQSQKMIKQQASIQRRVQPPRKKLIQKMQKPEQTKREKTIKEESVHKAQRVQQRSKVQKLSQVTSNMKQKQYIQAIQRREMRIKEEQKERREAIKYQQSHGKIRIGKDFQSCLPAYLLNQQELMIWKQEKKHALLQRQIQSTNYF